MIKDYVSLRLTTIYYEFGYLVTRQLPLEQLVSIIVQQQRVIEQLTIEVNRLKASQNLDSQTTSSPPSTDDLLKKPEQAKAKEQPADEKKRKPGGQPGHVGKTRKGFGRVDRYKILQPQVCLKCGSVELAAEPVAVQVQQVAQLKAEQWWYFQRPPGSATRLNPAQSDRCVWLKPARKVSGGSRSMKRFTQTADELRVVQTCRRRSFLASFCPVLRDKL